MPSEMQPNEPPKRSKGKIIGFIVTLVIVSLLSLLPILMFWLAAAMFHNTYAHAVPFMGLAWMVFCGFVAYGIFFKRWIKTGIILLIMNI